VSGKIEEDETLLYSIKQTYYADAWVCRCSGLGFVDGALSRLSFGRYVRFPKKRQSFLLQRERKRVEIFDYHPQREKERTEGIVLTKPQHISGTTYVPSSCEGSHSFHISVARKFLCMHLSPAGLYFKDKDDRCSTCVLYTIVGSQTLNHQIFRYQIRVPMTLSSTPSRGHHFRWWPSKKG
jgi:hypothetical protein